MREYWVVFLKTRRARAWQPVEIFARKGNAMRKYKSLRKQWLHLDIRASLVREAE